MPLGRGCPPGRDFEEDECRQQKRDGSGTRWKFGKVGIYEGWLPKCLLTNGDLVYYNRGGRVPPSKSKFYHHKALCKTKRTSTTTTTMPQSPPGNSSSHIWSISSKDQFDHKGHSHREKRREKGGIFPPLSKQNSLSRSLRLSGQIFVFASWYDAVSASVIIWVPRC